MGDEAHDARAMWLWDDALAPEAVVDFAHRERVGEVFLTVPWAGPSAATRTLSRSLRRRGTRVACLGSGADWADAPPNAAAWANRALADGDFDAVHLDVEPWAADDWPAHNERRLGGLADAVRAVRATTRLPVEVDVPAALVNEFPLLFAASAVTIMSYRDRAPAILDLSNAAREVAASVGSRYRIGVDTTPSAQPHTTFADDGRRVLERETAAAVSALRSDPLFAGIAMHDYAGWSRLAP
ncbi:hypothetical protein SAMN04487846_2781 [Microbacterium sp. cf046]|uniref:hypothetical protein n=1 Tax=Microbacterium sp. cf046 TaxID=1761803 RepID=UPI0008E65D29|nr:hypothetical protein [Microbacterium sp. cf046]SFS13806.1 hypothetical protein SAMN04487846_2781 [Microbacterium sp. cf046]